MQQICAVQLADLCTHSWVEQGRTRCFTPQWPAQIHPAPVGISSGCPRQVRAAGDSTEPFQPCRGCRSPVTSLGTPSRRCTAPLHRWARLVLTPGHRLAACSLDTPGKGTCKEMWLAKLPWGKAFSVYSWYSHNQSKCSVNTHNIVYKQLMGLGFADICAVVGKAKGTWNN